MDSTYIVTAGEIAACICMFFDTLILMFTIFLVIMSLVGEPDKITLTLESCLGAAGKDAEPKQDPGDEKASEYVALRKDFGKYLIPCVCLVLLNLLVLDWLVVVATR